MSAPKKSARNVNTTAQRGSVRNARNAATNRSLSSRLACVNNSSSWSTTIKKDLALAGPQPADQLLDLGIAAMEPLCVIGGEGPHARIRTSRIGELRRS